MEALCPEATEFLTVTALGRALPWEVLDAALVAFIIRQIVLALRPAREVLIGIAVVTVLGLYAIHLRLMVLSAFVRLVSPVALLICLVLFQPELRIVISSLGRSLTPVIPSVFEAPYVEEIVQAADRFSKRRIGALIGIERAHTLQLFAERGARMNAEVSSQLLMYIFHTGSPFHDGSVMIRNGTILAACCLVPVYDGPVRDNIGMRHRAAIGLSIATDAVVVVVSQETGIISVARAGNLERRFNSTGLRLELRQALGVGRPLGAPSGWLGLQRIRGIPKRHMSRIATDWRLLTITLGLSVLMVLGATILTGGRP